MLINDKGEKNGGSDTREQKSFEIDSIKCILYIHL